MAYRRPCNLKDELVRAKVRKKNDVEKGMKMCGKSRCQTCGFVDEGCIFQGERTYFIKVPLIVIHLEWFTFYLVRYVIRSMSEVLLRLSENVSIITSVVLPGMAKDRRV